jgi:hypothetical protein
MGEVEEVGAHVQVDPRCIFKADAVAEGLVHEAGEQAGLQAGSAEESKLGESNALDGEMLLGVDGLVESDGVVVEVGESWTSSRWTTA